jgi:MYXO-CTERM domain-containing protein
MDAVQANWQKFVASDLNVRYDDVCRCESAGMLFQEKSMQRLVLFCRSFAVAVLLAMPLGVARAEQVNYHGDVTLSGDPVANGYVIAGTFKSTFDPFTYKYEYGIDEAGNMDSPRLSEAIADGNFIPIGTGATTAPDGSFSGGGLNLAGDGKQIYLFAFNKPDADSSDLFALASNPSWLTSGTAITIDGENATQFVFGRKAGPTIALEVLPVPEPTAAAMAATALGGLALVRRRRWS